MSAVAFDTLKLATQLEQSGFSAEQAKGAAIALSDALADELVTKTYLDIRLAVIKSDLETKIEATKAEILKWMFGQTLVLLGALFAMAKLTGMGH
jgi:hypothetical protein